MPRPLCSASSTASSAAGYAPSCASRKSAPAWDGAQPTINAGPMLSSRLTGYSPSAPPVSKRDIPDEETNDWRAVCGRTARTVRRAGRAQPFPTPIGESGPEKIVHPLDLVDPAELRADQDLLEPQLLDA